MYDLVNLNAEKVLVANPDQDTLATTKAGRQKAWQATQRPPAPDTVYLPELYELD
eukprot:gene31991-33917_t